jgi:formamidopyrimidine-DNA glycosylase
MPELAEVEYYRQQWNAGLGQRAVRIHLHPNTRVFRGTNTKHLLRTLRGLPYRQSWARGKQMLFQFGPTAWLGIHLGMTGKLRAEKLPFRPTRHDHLVITLQKRALVFTDPRQFGRVQFHMTPSGRRPDWWTKIPTAPTDPAFSQQLVRDFLARHPRLPIKAALLLQTGFPGIGNWMADEILWQSRIPPTRRTAQLSPTDVRTLWKTTRAICRTAMRTIARDFSDPPNRWLFHQRWSRKGRCPLHKAPLKCATIGGRTTVWCERCQVDPANTPLQRGD